MTSMELLDRMSELRVAVLGDAILDLYTCGAVHRLCPEFPAPVFDLGTDDACPGGAANTAANAAALGAETELLTVVGNDPEGEELTTLLGARGVNTSGMLRSADRRTLTKRRLQAGSQMLLRMDQGTTGPLPEQLETDLLERLVSPLQTCDVLLVSDYAYGVVTPNLIERLARRRTGLITAVDSKSLPRLAGWRPTIAKPNWHQAVELLGLPETIRDEDRASALVACSSELFRRTGANVVVVTLDRDGSVCLTAGEPPVVTEAEACPAAHVSGAGDTFLAAFAMARGAGASLGEAAGLATRAAGIVIEKDRTAVCGADELRRDEAGLRRSWDLSGLVDQIAADRRQGRRIVLTNGCFDILHHGHVDYLKRARALGDRLIVGVNSDESIRRLKGPERPINPLADRLEVLAALGCVDYLVSFNEQTPHELIEALRPDVFVKGGDYTRDRLPEAELVERRGGRVAILPLVADRSTTRLIHRIRRADSSAPVSERAFS